MFGFFQKSRETCVIHHLKVSESLKFGVKIIKITFVPVHITEWAETFKITVVHSFFYNQLTDFLRVEIGLRNC